MKSRFVPSIRWAVAGVACLVLVLGVWALTGDSEEPEAAPAPSSSVESARTLEAKPVPLKVRVTRVAGTLAKAQREKLEGTVGAAIRAYLDAAWLGEFSPGKPSKTFPSFSKGAAKQASADREMTSNAGLGKSIESVVTKEKVAYLSVLAPNEVAAGVSARFRLRILVERPDATEENVTVSGRLLLTRKKSGGWQIFGYDVKKSVVPGAKGES